jgi:hypothetical protein
MVEGQESFPEFERLLEKERPPVYHEEYDYLIYVGVGLLLISVGIALFIIMESVSRVIQMTCVLLLPIGAILCSIGFIRNRSGRRKYQFRGLSRTVLSEAIMYLDSVVVQPDELESAAPYHDNIALSNFEKSKIAKGFVKFVNNTAGYITWPLDFVSEMKGDLERIRRRLTLLPLCAVLLSLLLLVAMYYVLISESITSSYLGIGLGFVGIYSIYCIAQSCYEYSRFPKLRNYETLSVSDSQKIEDTLSCIFTLLQKEYNYPLRLYVAGKHTILLYTGRTKTSFSLVRLKEAVLYPIGSIQNEMPL